MESHSTNLYNDILKKIKKLHKGQKNVVPKSDILKDILENFEKEHNILISGIFNEDGLEIVTGFQQKYIDEVKLGAYGSKLCDAALEFMKKVIAEPLTSKNLDELLKMNVRDRKTELKSIVLETTIERYNVDNLKSEQYITPILLSPVPGIGLIIMIVEHRENLALIKMNLDYLKDLICNILL
ncbi:MAG: hypothetical protein ACFFCM_02425 [Promethearchaeota archaeon]